MALQVQAGDWLEGPFWHGAVQVVSVQSRAGHDLVAVALPEQGATFTYVLAPADWEGVRRIAQTDRSRITFGGDPTRFRLGIQAHRLRLAHAIDPYAALNASRIDPLPHQFEAVYQHLLARPVVRGLLAHDAGAGKTIMAGMLLKELRRRQGARRILIVAPAGLAPQWRRELLTKFGEDFTVISREHMDRTGLDSLEVWRQTDLAIVSIDFARQKLLRAALESVEWDAVIVDEAHKLAAYRRPNGSIQRTQAYQLGEILSRHTTHFLLMTATPHKGDPENYRLLINLLDPQWGEAAGYAPGPNPMVLRRAKEEMRRPDGGKLYAERIVETLPYNLTRPEGELLEQVQKFIRARYKRAQAANRQSAAFALLTLERRLASSPQALRESLGRMRDAVHARLQRTPAAAPATAGDEGAWEEWEELAEAERWEREAQAEVAAGELVEARQLRAELQHLEGLIGKAEAIVRHGQQEKIAELKKACDLWVGQRGQQLIIFTEFKDTLDHLLECLAAWGYTATQIHGEMPVKARRQAEKTFWDGVAQVLVATEAAGEGINLQCCHVMINFDIPWNPCRLEQRMGRIHRYGQQAPEVRVFNLVAGNTLEGQVQAALLDKQKQMRRDLGDKVFDVVGQVLWGQELRAALERVALGEAAAVDEAVRIIDTADAAARAAIEAERGVTITADPLDVADFRRCQATFRAHRLSPEESENFFRLAVPFIGGALREFEIRTSEVSETSKVSLTRPAFEVALPADFCKGRPRKLTLSFWPAACSDDDSDPNGVFFIAPGHWLFEALLDRVMADCAPDLAAGAIYHDLRRPEGGPELVWFLRSQVRDGLNRTAADLLAAVRHRADQERVTPAPSEILDAFDEVAVGKAADHGSVASDVGTGIRQAGPMLAAQAEIADQCVADLFLPELAGRRAAQQAALARDQRFLEAGLNALAEQLNAAALDAYSQGDADAGERLIRQGEAAQDRLKELRGQMARAGQLLLLAPEVVGVALVLPAPITVALPPGKEESVGGRPMHRDPAVELAAMAAVMEYETRQGRFPRDVHVGHSWDIESDDAQGVTVRYIEVKGRGPEDADVVELTDPEWEAARRLGDQHWLYIVRLADDRVWPVRNPYAKLMPKEHRRWIVRIEDAERFVDMEAS